MDIWQVLVIGVRRWKITVPLAVLGVALAWVYSGGVQPVYTAEASLLYLPPAVTIIEQDPGLSTTDDEAVEVIQVNNPFAGSLRSASLAVELYMTSDSVRADLSGQGLSGSYTATTDRRNAVLKLAVEAKSPAIATDTIAELITIAATDLQDRQDGFDVDRREQVTVQAVTQDEVATADFGGRVRVRVILLVLALGFAFGIGVAVEGLLDHRAGRRPFASPDEGVPVGNTLTIQIPDSLVREMGMVGSSGGPALGEARPVGDVAMPIPAKVVDAGDDEEQSQPVEADKPDNTHSGQPDNDTNSDKSSSGEKRTTGGSKGSGRAKTSNRSKATKGPGSSKDVRGPRGHSGTRGTNGDDKRKGRDADRKSASLFARESGTAARDGS